MGAALSTESVLTTAVVVGAVAVGYHQYTTAPSAGSSSAAKPKKKKKGPEQKKTVDASSLPGQFEVPSSTPAKPKKAKKKTTITESNPQPPAQQSTTSIDTDGSWTRVESRKKVGQGGELGSIRTVDITTTSDAGITPSVTESSVDEDSGDKRTTVDEWVAKPFPCSLH
jgi:cell wall-associated NlpC family hydrolase